MSKSCVVFDFDGVIADTEALHLQAYNATFANMSARIGGPLRISAEAYFGNYIVYGNHDGFLHMLRDHGRSYEEALLASLSAHKDQLFTQGIGQFVQPLAGVRETLAYLTSVQVPLAICSGARRVEILHLLTAFKLAQHFSVIVAIEDVQQSKPAPEGYTRAFDQLNALHGSALNRAQSLAIEDSLGGITAARSSGLQVLAVGTSLPLHKLRNLTPLVVNSLSEVTVPQWRQWLNLG
jgi:beta-phosphoglucomutase